MRKLEMENLGMEWQLLFNTFSFSFLSLSCVAFPLCACTSSHSQAADYFPCAVAKTSSLWQHFSTFQCWRQKGTMPRGSVFSEQNFPTGPSAVGFYCQSSATKQSVGMEGVEVDRQLAVPIIVSKVHAYLTHQYLNITYQLYNPICNC